MCVCEEESLKLWMGVPYVNFLVPLPLCCTFRTCLDAFWVGHVDDPAAALARVERTRVQPEHADALGVVLREELRAVQRESVLSIPRLPDA